MTATSPVWRIRLIAIGFVVLSAAALTNVMTQNLAPGLTPGKPSVSVNGTTSAASPRDPSAATARTIPAQTVRDIQSQLTARGFDTGVQDGTVTLITRASIFAFEHDAGLTLTAEPSEALLKAILLGTAMPGQANTRPAAGPQAEQLTRTVQAALISLGHLKVRASGLPAGRLDADTIRAIKAFELSERLPATGRISGPMMRRLERRAALGQLTAAR